MLIGHVIFTIAKAGMQVFRTGKTSYTDMKPYIADLSSKSKRAQELSSSFADRGAKLSKSLDELNGRWAFIAQTIAGTQRSPVVKMAKTAGKLASDKGKDKGKGA